MKKLFLAFCFFCLSVHGARSNTVRSVPPDYDSVNNAINGVTSGPVSTYTGFPLVDGDECDLQAGTATWTSILTVANKNITIKGAGMGVTTITSAIRMMTVTTDDNNFGTTSAKTFRLTGLTLNTTGAAGVTVLYMSGFSRVAVISGTAYGGFRIDHVQFTGTMAPQLIWFSGWLTGVVDHYRIDQGGSSTTFGGGPHGGETILVHHSAAPDNSPAGVQFGDYSWFTPYNFATIDAIYFEDGVINRNGFCIGTLGQSDGGAGRYVFRHNTTAGSAGGGHGTETNGRGRGMRAGETYNNNYYVDPPHDEAGLTCRSGSFVIFKNRYTGMAKNGNPVNLAAYRSGSNLSSFHGADGTNPWDLNYRNATAQKLGTTTNITGPYTGTDDGLGSWRGLIYKSVTSPSAGQNQVTAVGSTTVSTTSGIYNLPDLAHNDDNEWNGYIIRNTTITNTFNHWAWITASSALAGGGTTIVTNNGLNNASTGVQSMALASTDNWEIRRVTAMMDVVGSGSGATALISGAATALLPNPPVWTGETAEGAWRWGSLKRLHPTDSFGADPVWGSGWFNPSRLLQNIPMTVAAGGPIDYPWNPTDTGTGTATVGNPAMVGADSTIINYAPLGITNDPPSYPGSGPTGIAGVGGYTYPHPLTGCTSPAITSSASATFSTSGGNPSFTVTTCGFSGSPTFSETGSLNGLSFSSAGVLSGTPTGPAGNYPIVITATGSPSNATQNFTIVVQSPTVNPSIAWVSPPTGSSFVAPTTITLSATPTAGTFPIASVSYYYGGTNLIGTSTVSPWSVNWNVSALATYSLTAKATDTQGNVSGATSPAISVTITGASVPTPPLIKLKP